MTFGCYYDLEEEKKGGKIFKTFFSKVSFFDPFGCYDDTEIRKLFKIFSKVKVSFTFDCYYDFEKKIFLKHIK